MTHVINNPHSMFYTDIVPCVVAMGYPSEGLEAGYRNPMDEVVRFFETRHNEAYRVYNLYVRGSLYGGSALESVCNGV